MPIGGTRETKTIGNSYRKSDLYNYSKSFVDTAQAVLKESGYDIFEEPQKLLRRKEGKAALRKFFTEGFYDENNTTLDEYDLEDMNEQVENQFENDVEAMYEHAAPAEYNPIVGMALPIHKLILMNNVYDKGVA